MDRTRRLLVAAIAVAAVLLWPASAAADVLGGCTAQGVASTSSPINITTDSVWHVHRADSLRGAAQAPSPQTHVTVDVVFFGLHPPFAHLIDRTGTFGTEGGGGPFNVSDFARFGRVFAATGGSDSCSGTLVIVVDDVSALSTLAGGIALGLGIAGLLGMLLASFLRGRVSSRAVGAVMGLLSGTGFGLFVQQAGWVDPTSLRTLAIPAAGLIGGILIGGALAPLRPLPASP